MTRRSGAIVFTPARHPSRVVLLDALQAGVICQQATREYRLFLRRRWRLDLAWPAHKVAVELQGGAYIGGHHVRGHGFEEDCEKILTAAAAGWRIVPITWGMLEHKFKEMVILLDAAMGCTDPVHAHAPGRSGGVVNNGRSSRHAGAGPNKKEGETQ